MSEALSIPPGWEQKELIVESYNQAQKLLVLLDIFNWSKDGLAVTLDPFNFVIDKINQLYEESTIDLLESLQGIAKIEAGSEIPDETGAIITVEEDYLLKEVVPLNVTPLSVIELQPEMFKYSRIRLIYKALSKCHLQPPH